MPKNILIFSDGTGQIAPTFTNYFEQRGVVRIRQSNHPNRLLFMTPDWVLPEIIISLSVGSDEKFTM
jgi:hypothetical protein